MESESNKPPESWSSRLEDAAEWLNEHDASTVLLFVDSRSVQGDSGARLDGALAEVETRRFDNFTPNPSKEALTFALDCVYETQPDAFVAIGGGTAIDLAKISAACYGARVAPGDPFPESFQRPPLLAIPTTAGTGAEATHFAVMYDKGIKQSIAHEQVRPDAAIVDPSLSFTAPRHVAAASGFDALCQAYESLLSRKATPRSKSLATLAHDLLRGSLEAAILERDSQAHTEVARGAYLSGCAIDISFTNAVHALSYPLTSRLGIPHGEALAILFPHVMEALGIHDHVATEIVQLRDRLELPKTVAKEFPPEEFAAEISIQRLENAPGHIDRAGIEWIYRSCIANA